MVEFASLLAREVRMGALQPAAARKADARFAQLLADSFGVVCPDAADFVLARNFLQRYETGLRAGDALHLTVASNRHAGVVYSLDKSMVKAGKLLGLRTSLGIRV
jgi:predicted nucleic acid-binding protein